MMPTMLLFAFGLHRCKMYISRTFDMNVNDARKLVFASTSRVSLWHRTPSSMRVIGYGTSPAIDTAAARPQPAPVQSTSNDSLTVG